jgi:hypothetical protein
MSSPKRYTLLMEVHFVAKSPEAAHEMGEKLVGTWNNQVQPDIPSAFVSVQPHVDEPKSPFIKRIIGR